MAKHYADAREAPSILVPVPEVLLVDNNVPRPSLPPLLISSSKISNLSRSKNCRMISTSECLNQGFAEDLEPLVVTALPGELISDVRVTRAKAKTLAVSQNLSRHHV